MDLNTILSELRRLESLVEGWSSKEQISAIERDLALDKLKSLYEAVRFAEAVSSEESPLQEASTGISSPFAEPLKPEDPVSAEEGPEPLEEEPAVIDFEDLMLAEEPMEEPLESMEEPMEPIREEPAPETEAESETKSEALPETETEAEAWQGPIRCEEPQPEEPVSEPEVPREEEILRAEETQSPDEKAIAEESPVEGESVEEEFVKVEPQAPVLQNSLFDLSEIPVHRRSSRRVLLSLYGESPEPRSSKRKHREPSKPDVKEIEKEQIVDQAVELAAPKSEKSAWADIIREEQKRVEEKLPAEPAMAVEPQEESLAEEPIFREEEVTTEVVTPQPTSEPAPVLGEVIHADQQTLADTFAAKPTVASSLHAAGGSLKERIALNDRYLLRKELFEGDESAFLAAIEELDRMPSLDDCMIYIAENFAWNANSEAARMLVELLVNKYGE